MCAHALQMYHMSIYMRLKRVSMNWNICSEVPLVGGSKRRPESAHIAAECAHMDHLFLLKYWLLACCQFCEKCSFFPYCYGQFSVIVCALFASASGKKTIARVTRIGKICRILFDILTPDRLYSSWMSLPFVDFFALGASASLWG